MRKIVDIFRKIKNFFLGIEEKLIDDFEGYDKEQNMED